MGVESSRRIAQLCSELPFWGDLLQEEKEAVLGSAGIRSFAKGQLLSSSDTSCMGVVYVLRGGLRVSLLSEEGREVTLYRLFQGDCCVATASCVIQQITFDTSVTATGETEVLVIPTLLCERLSRQNIHMKVFMLETETKRFSQAIWVIQQLLFKRFDQRLAGYLVAASEAAGSVDLKMTQEEIARDVNSAREVVARMLRHFASEGLVEVRRGHVVLLDLNALKALA